MNYIRCICIIYIVYVDINHQSSTQIRAFPDLADGNGFFWGSVDPGHMGFQSGSCGWSANLDPQNCWRVNASDLVNPTPCRNPRVFLNLIE